jgi:hypothetical protein
MVPEVRPAAQALNSAHRRPRSTGAKVSNVAAAGFLKFFSYRPGSAASTMPAIDSRTSPEANMPRSSTTVSPGKATARRRLASADQAYCQLAAEILRCRSAVQIALIKATATVIGRGVLLVVVCRLLDIIGP